MKFPQPNRVKRLAIFSFSDPDGIVDDYIPYLLRDLKKNIDELLVVCNGSLTEAGRKKFNQFTSRILVRENTGFSVWAYKTGMEYIGWDELSQYDEVILMDSANMGPVFPLKEMFAEMSGRDVDFWGITCDYGMDTDPWGKCKYGYIPAHIESSFMVMRSSLIKSPLFQQYWQETPVIHDPVEAFCWHEAIFTEDFTRAGFISDTYVNTEDLKGYGNSPLLLYPAELIARRRCPIFRRDIFSGPYSQLLDVSCGQAAIELYRTLVEKTDYDPNLIWETVLRTANLADVKERLQLNYVLPVHLLLTASKEKPRVALFLHLYYMDQLDHCKHYAASMPPYADIFITTDTDEKKSRLETAFKHSGFRHVKVLQVKNRGREISAHLIGLKSVVDQYDLVCFAHDKKTSHLKPYIKGESFSYHCFENILASPAFVENVIATFQQNPRLGLLVPPTPIHADFSIVIGAEWQVNFENVCRLARRLHLTVNIDPHKPPIAPLGGMYWYRVSALKPLFEAGLVYEDFPPEPLQEHDGTILHAIERIYPYVVQQSGYFSGWVLSDTYTKMELTNLYRMLADFNQALLSQFGPINRHEHLNLIMRAAQNERKIPILIQEMAEKEFEAQTRVAQLELEVQIQKALADSYAQSTSWKITKPIRKMKDLFSPVKKKWNSTE